MRSTQSAKRKRTPRRRRNAEVPIEDVSRELAGNAFLAEGGPREIAGYRVVRRLAAGRRVTVFLGHPLAHRGGDSVALKVFHHEAEPASVDLEIAVLLEAPAGIAAPVHDVVTLPDGRLCVVQERDDGMSLAELLHSRGSLRAGEAVTILAPVVVGLDRLHTLGWAHGGVSVANVRFDSSGKPRLGRWAGALMLGDGKERTRRLRDEYVALSSLIADVCRAIEPQSVATHEVEAMLEWVSEAVNVHPFIPPAVELEHRLFALARALPVRLPRSEDVARPAQEDRSSPHSAGRTVAPLRGGTVPNTQQKLAAPTEPRAVHQSNEATDEPDRAPSPAWLTSALGNALGDALGDAVNGSPVKRWCSLAHIRFATMARQRRRPFIVAACSGAAALVLMITLLPPDASAQGKASDAVEAAQNSESSSARPTPSPDALSLLSAADEVPRDTAGEDPLAAATALLARREECYRESSLLCINEVSAPGSPLADADGFTIRRAQESGVVELPVALDTATLTLIEQNGGAAVLAVSLLNDPERDDVAEKTKPASLLMIRGEAGWRLRELFGP